MSESSQLESPVYTVIVSEKGGPERREVFRTGEVTVGRVQGNDIVLPRGNVSKRHARVLYREGRFIVTDLNSTNGTYVNRRRIAQATIIREEDKIYVGDFVIRVEPGEVDASEPQVSRGTQPDRDSTPEGRVSSIDWDRPSSYDEQRVSSGPPAGLAGISEAPAAVSTVSQSVEDLSTPHLRAVAEVVRVASAALGEIPIDWTVEEQERVEALVSEAADDLMLRGAVPTGTSVAAIIAQARGELVDLGPLNELVADPSVTTITVARHDDVVARRDDRLVNVSPGFSSASSLELAIRRLCARGGEALRADEHLIERQLVDARLSALMGPVAASGPVLVLRKSRRISASLDGLVRRGTVSRSIATFLTHCVASRVNVLVVGPYEDGAATLMSALCRAVARDRLIAVADQDEFAPPGAAHLSLRGAAIDPSKLLELVASVSEGRLAVHLSSPQIALAALEAMGNGATGVIASLSSSDLRRALIRLPADLCALRPGMSLQVASAWIQGSFDLLVEVARLRDGRIRTLRVAELGYSEQAGPVLHDIFRFNIQRVAVGGSVEGSFGPTGYVPRLAGQLQALGANIESSMFSRPPSR